MLYKDDWEQAKKRMQAWWAGEVIDRVVMQVRSKRKGIREIDHTWTWWNFMHNLSNPEKCIESFEKYCRTTFFGGESFPNLWLNMGPGITAAYLGCEPIIEPTTVWFETPGNVSLDSILELELDSRNIWWKRTKEWTTLAVKHGKDKYLTSITDLNATLNIIASFRKTERLLADLIDSPEEVIKASEHVTSIWLSCYDELAEITGQFQKGVSTWMGIWFPGRGSDIQCDFSAMISPNMFEKFVVPSLEEQCRRLDYTIYHWDGPGQIPHLEMLLDIPGLDGIQWVPGAGNPGLESPKWFPLYKRIQEKGKRLVLQGIPKQHIENVLDNLSPKGLLISTSADTEEEARDILRKTEQWTKTK